MRLLLILSCLGSVVLSLGMTSPTYAAKAAHWTTCTFRLDHTEAKTCVRHRMPRRHKRPTGHRKHCSWTGSDWRCVTYPTFHPKSVQPTGGYQQLWLVTYYVDSGLMADGNSTYWGAAACGDEVPFYARVFVPGVGLLNCEDHEACQPPFTCFHHVDVWGYHPGLGADWRTVTVYP